MVHRVWKKPHSEGFDFEYEDFSLTYVHDDIGRNEDILILAAINGFSCGYPECCVLDFLRRIWNQEPKRKLFGVTKTGQPYGRCPNHEV